MIGELLKRAQEIKQRNALLASTPGTGYHDNDRIAPQNRNPPQPRLDNHLVRFQDQRGDLHFVGDDALAVVEAIKRAADHCQQNFGSSRMPGSEFKIMMTLPKRYSAAESNGDGVPHLLIWHEDWNDVLFAFEIVGLGVTGVMV